MAAEAKNAHPEWTEYAKKNGLDPLGMQTSSVGYYQTLLPGISNVTLRIRYYGYYAWLSYIYAEKIRDTDPTTWQRFVRRAEAFYALVAQAKGGETGIAGVTWAGGALEGADDHKTINFAEAADPGSEIRYLKQAWGAYGAAYGSQLYEIDIFAEAREHNIPVPSDEVGIELALAFSESISPVDEKVFQILEKGSIRKGELAEFVCMLPSVIPAGSKERDLYEDLLFDQIGLEKHGHEERKLTLLLILELAKRARKVPTPSETRWMLYGDRDLDGSPLSLDGEELAHQSLKWRVYQANDLLHVAYETLLRFALDVLEPHPTGLSMASLVDECLDQLEKSHRNLSLSWADFVEQLDGSDPSLDENLCSKVMKVGHPARACGPETAMEAVQLLAVVVKRAESIKDEIQTAFGMLEQSVFKSLVTEMNYLDLVSDESLATVIAKVIGERVLRRHTWVAMKKLRYQGDYTFLFESDDGKVRLRVKDGPVLTNPRLGPAIGFLEDIYLINNDGITQFGEKVLTEA